MTRYLKQKKIGRVFIRTEKLAERSDMTEISEKEAKRILAGEPEQEVKTELSPEAQLTLLAEAIGNLDMVEDFTKGGIAQGGKPDLAALEAMSGVSGISAAVRDAAFDKYQADQKG